MEFETGKNDATIKRYEPIADMIHTTFGANCEVVIHNLQDVHSSLVYIKGSVTGREIGAPTTEVILKELRQQGNEVQDRLGFTTKTKEGKSIKTSITFIRNDVGEVIGYLGINFDISAFAMIGQIMNEFTGSNEIQLDGEIENESYAKNIDEVFEQLLTTALSKIGVPVSRMSRTDKIRFVHILEEKGTFLIQGSIEHIAQVLEVSKQTVYNYLEQKLPL